MSLVVREVRESDIEELYQLALQFSLINLPAEKKRIEEKVEMSVESFSSPLSREKSLYIFVIEDLENKKIIGSSQIVGQKGTKQNPAYSFKILKKERFSKNLGIGFTHQILRLQISESGPSEIGGLVVDRNHRRRPEKIGQLMSLSRFMFMGHRPELFSKEILAEMAPPLTKEGHSEFWEFLGRQFTGMPYQEADKLSFQNKEFIKSLFPEEDIYMCLLDRRARMVVGQVGEQTQPALHLLESLGFKYNDEVDPFDGGPHLSVKTQEIKIIKNLKKLKIKFKKGVKFNGQGMVSYFAPPAFRCMVSAYLVDDDQLILPPPNADSLGVEEGQSVLFYAFEK